MERQRPMGISVLGILGLAVGGWHLLLAMFALAYASNMVIMSAWTGYFPTYMESSVVMNNLGSILLAAGGALALVIASIGLLTLRRWAYWLAMAGAGISVLVHVLPALQGAVNGTSTISALLAAVVLVYLFLPGVRQVFLAAPTSVPSSQA